MSYPEISQENSLDTFLAKKSRVIWVFIWGLTFSLIFTTSNCCVHYKPAT